MGYKSTLLGGLVQGAAKGTQVLALDSRAAAVPALQPGAVVTIVQNYTHSGECGG